MTPQWLPLPHHTALLSLAIDIDFGATIELRHRANQAFRLLIRPAKSEDIWAGMGLPSRYR